MRCSICNRTASSKLCYSHAKDYVWDAAIHGFRLKKRGRGSRYNKKKFHVTETKLARIVENAYGKSNVITSFYPEWAITSKGVLYEYDILIRDKSILIGYNGEQHYKYTKFFHKTLSRFHKQVSNDKIKRLLSDIHGYKFIEFSYKEPIVREYVVEKIRRTV